MADDDEAIDVTDVSDKTPLQRAAEAIRLVTWNPDQERMSTQFARSALTAATEDREGLARVLDDHRDVGGDVFYACECGWPRHIDATSIQFAAHQADAVARWLTGGKRG